MKVALVSLTTVILSNMLAIPAISSERKLQCPNPFPKTYKSPKNTRYIRIPNLGIAIKAQADERLVYIKKERRFTVMTPPEYKSYQCSLRKGLSYLSFYPYKHSLSYKVIKNPKRLSIEKALEESEKLDGDYAEYSTGGVGYQKVRFNGTDFITTPTIQDDPVRAWFIPRARPDIVVLYSRFCDCGDNYKDLLNHLKRIKSI
jgi:hypothetical protein